MISLLAGDCLEVMSTLPSGSADALIMDPPFTAAGGSTNGRTSASDGQFFLHWLRAVFAETRRIVRSDGCGFIHCDWQTIGLVKQAMSPLGTRQTAEAWEVTQALVWDRESMGLGSPFRNSWEMIAFARGPDWVNTLPKDIVNLTRCRWVYGRHEFHGAEKPVELCRQLVRWALPQKGTVLDPFMGSGTVGVAALAEGCGYLGIEVEPDVFAVAERRVTHAAEGAPPRVLSLFGATQ